MRWFGPHLALIFVSSTLATACAATAPRTDSGTDSAAAAPADASEPTPAQAQAQAQAQLEAARVFQRSYEQELRDDPRSFLTVVASHYLRPGEQLQLAFADGSVRAQPDGELRFEATDDALLVQTPSGTERVEQRAMVELGDDGRWAWSGSKQETQWRVLIHDRDAPTRTGFAGIRWFEVDPAFIVEAVFVPAELRSAQVVQTSRGISKTLYLAGEVQFELAGQALRLQVFAYEPTPTPDEPLLIPFRDRTSGHESYPPGRYLEPTLPAGSRMSLDFNRATNPLCAYSEHYNCPIPPKPNHLPVEIRAGAMTSH